MGKWSSLPGPQFPWEPRSGGHRRSSLPPSRRWANLPSHLAQICSLHPCPRSSLSQGSGLPPAILFPCCSWKHLLKHKFDHVTPLLKIRPQGRFKMLNLAFKALHSSAASSEPSPCPTATADFQDSPIPLDKWFLQSGMSLLLLALFHPEYSYSYCKAQLRGPSTKKPSLIS